MTQKKTDSVKNPDRPGPPYSRIVIKAGTNVLTNNSSTLDPSIIASLVSQIAEIKALGIQVILVTSGAIGAGRQELRNLSDSGGTPARQILAAIGQSILMHSYQEQFSQSKIVVAQALLTRRDLEDRLGYLNIRNTLEGLLKLGVIPVINENDVVNVEEILTEGFGDNDQLSALVANLIEADFLLILTDSGGLYTADPHRNKNAQLVPLVEDISESVLAKVEKTESESSRGGMHSKLMAAKFATSCGITVVFAPGVEPDAVIRATRGESIGTLFPAQTSRLESRKRWMLSGLKGSGGKVIIDGGAKQALINHQSSLLPAGILEVQGDFKRGDIITVLGPQKDRIACGIVNYDAADVERIIGLQSEHVIELLGYSLGDEVIHRDNMVNL